MQNLRDRVLIPQVYFFSVRENRGEGAETSENLKLEENVGGGGTKTNKNLRKMTKTLCNMNKSLKKHLVIYF